MWLRGKESNLRHQAYETRWATSSRPAVDYVYLPPTTGDQAASNVFSRQCRGSGKRAKYICKAVNSVQLQHLIRKRLMVWRNAKCCAFFLLNFRNKVNNKYQIKLFVINDCPITWITRPLHTYPSLFGSWKRNLFKAHYSMTPRRVLQVFHIITILLEILDRQYSLRRLCPRCFHAKVNMNFSLISQI